MPVVTDTDDLVTLVDDGGTPCGTAPRATVHQRQTPLHLAFSCYVTRPSGEVLITRRALTKAAWPGVWTNSCCGHPRPGESVESAVVRRVREELGLELTVIEPLIPGYRYTAVDATGIMENEICPVYLGIADSGDVHPDPGEVAEFRWSPWQALCLVAEAAPWLLSPWAAEQMSLLGPHLLAAELLPSSRRRSAEPTQRHDEPPGVIRQPREAGRSVTMTASDRV